MQPTKLKTPTCFVRSPIDQVVYFMMRSIRLPDNCVEALDLKEGAPPQLQKKGWPKPPLRCHDVHYAAFR